MLYDCVFAGLNTIDVISLVDRKLQEDEKIFSRQIIVDGGGPCATSSCAASKLGIRAALITALGSDEWTHFALNNLKKYGVSTDFVEVSPKLKNPVSMIFVNPKNAARTIIWNSQGLANHKFKLSPKIFNTKAFHFDGHLMDLSIRLAGQAKQKNILVSYDCGSVKQNWEELAKLTDVFIASHKFSSQLGLSPQKTVLELHKRFGFKIAVTAGEKGCYYFDQDSKKVELIKQKKFKSIDTTGCGDVFHGAFLARYIKGVDFKKSLIFAQKAAGLKTLKVGGRNAIPKRSEINV